MSACWEGRATDRPSFADLVAVLRDAEFVLAGQATTRWLPPGKDGDDEEEAGQEGKVGTAATSSSSGAALRTNSHEVLAARR